MNPVPRFLALSLLVVLAVLAAMLALPALRNPVPSGAPTMAATPPAARPAAARAAAIAQRVAFPIALTGLVLAAALAVSLGVRAQRPADAGDAVAPLRAEMGALAKLAETSVAQGEQLAHERGVRQRAEADALFNQQLLNRALEEKIRLGRDLHDGIIQSLYAAGLTIESARAIARTNLDAADRQLGECRANLNQTIRDVRAYIAGLAPDNLRDANFSEALSSLVHGLAAGRAVQFELQIDDHAAAGFTPEQSFETLQIAREAVSNSLRHGQATQITVRLQPGDGQTCLLVQDNGSGFEPTRGSNGHGLGNMRARAEQLGGTLRVESTPGNGTRVVFTLPGGGGSESRG